MNFKKKTLMTISALIVMSCLLIVPWIAQVLSSQPFWVPPTQNSVFDFPPQTFSLFPSQTPVFNFALPPPLINATPQFFFPQQGFNWNIPFAVGQSTNLKSNSLKTSGEETANDKELENWLLELMPANAEIYKYHVNAKNASVNFIYETDCEETDVFLQISDEIIKYAPGRPERPGPMGFLALEIWNMCDDDDNDDEQYGYAQIELTSFSIADNLRSAYAEGYGTLEWEDPNDEEPITEEVTIKITWTGESAVSSGHNNSRSKFGNIRTYMHSSGTNRYATATGLIKGETFEIEVKPPPPPEPYPYVQQQYPPYPAPYPYYYGFYGTTIGKSKSGFLSIWKH